MRHCPIFGKIKYISMNEKLYCQNCGRPVHTLADLGTEKNGSANSDYCRDCYNGGSFTYPKLTRKQASHLAHTERKLKHLHATNRFALREVLGMFTV